MTQWRVSKAGHGDGGRWHSFPASARSFRPRWLTDEASTTLTEHWDGTSWTVVSTPSPGTDTSLSSVTATSATNAWAVGSTGTDAGNTTLIERWNGTAWTVTPSP